jgi:Ca2+-binding EF-hand superfamily protein
MTKKDFAKIFKTMCIDGHMYRRAFKNKIKYISFANKIFSAIDISESGYISFIDFVICYDMLTSSLNCNRGDFAWNDRCLFAFRFFDTDKNERLSRDELIDGLNSIYDLNLIQERKGHRSPQHKVNELFQFRDFVTTDPKFIRYDKFKTLVVPKNSKKHDFIDKEVFLEACRVNDAFKYLFLDSLFTFPENSDYQSNRYLNKLVNMKVIILEKLKLKLYFH